MDALNRLVRFGDIPALKEKAVNCDNIVALYRSIGEDEFFLERIDLFPFFETPLHKAASKGDTLFAMEIMRLKPSFARKPNLEGLSPIHLALNKHHTEVVRRLLQVDGSLVRVKGREGITPLHYAAKEGDDKLLAEFLSFCPDSIEDVTIRNETALHVALTNQKLETFTFLVGWLRKNWTEKSIFWERTVLNWKDKEGDTVLHVAVTKNQTQAVELLLNCGVDINVKNLKNKTAAVLHKNRLHISSAL
ncbi:hypothetical protein ACB092_08G166500 [Castanea dentata]